MCVYDFMYIVGFIPCQSILKYEMTGDQTDPLQDISLHMTPVWIHLIYCFKYQQIGNVFHGHMKILVLIFCLKIR